MKKVLFSEHDLINERLNILLERTRFTASANGEQTIPEEKIIAEMSQTLAETTLKQILLIDMGNDATTVQTIKMFAKETLKNIKEAENEK